MKCPYCGTEYQGSYCPTCGSNNKEYIKEEKVEEPKYEEKVFVEKEAEINTQDTRPQRSKMLMLILSLLFGTFGIQNFYIGRPVRGILCVLFCWTGIPSIVGVIEALIIAMEDTSSFEFRYKVKNVDKD